MTQMFVSSLNETLKELSAAAEIEIESRLRDVATRAIEEHKDKIVSEVTANLKMSCDARLVQLINSTGYQVEYIIRPKGYK